MCRRKKGKGRIKDVSWVWDCLAERMIVPLTEIMEWGRDAPRGAGGEV